MKTSRALSLILAGLLFGGSCAKVETQTEQESLLKDKDVEYVRTAFANMDRPVRLLLFTRDEDCSFCGLTEGFLEDLAAFSDTLEVEVLSLDKDAEQAASLGIDKAPGIAFTGPGRAAIRYFGLPTGYEFTAFVDAIVRTSLGDPGLDPATVAGLASLKSPVTITVFSTKS